MRAPAPLRATVLLALLAGGCRIGSGPRLEDFPPALGPRGVGATVRTPEAVVTGELLVVGDSTLLLLLAPEDGGPVVAEVGLPSVRLAEFAQLRGRIVRGAFVPEEARRRVRASSRYPQGLTPDQLAVLLAARGQDAVVRVP